MNDIALLELFDRFPRDPAENARSGSPSMNSDSRTRPGHGTTRRGTAATRLAAPRKHYPKLDSFGADLVAESRGSRPLARADDGLSRFGSDCQAVSKLYLRSMGAPLLPLQFCRALGRGSLPVSIAVFALSSRHRPLETSSESPLVQLRPSLHRWRSSHSFGPLHSFPSKTSHSCRVFTCKQLPTVTLSDLEVSNCLKAAAVRIRSFVRTADKRSTCPIRFCISQLTTIFRLRVLPLSAPKSWRHRANIDMQH